MPHALNEIARTAARFVFLLSVPVCLVAGLLGSMFGLLPSPVGNLLLLYAIVASGVAFKIGGGFSLFTLEGVRKFQSEFGKIVCWIGFVLGIFGIGCFVWVAAHPGAWQGILLGGLGSALIGTALFWTGDPKGEKVAQLDAEIAQEQVRQEAVVADVQEADDTTRAALAGDPLAQFMLSGRYAQGTGVQQDYQEALKWARLSAEQGNALGQSMVGDFYEKGYGVVVVDQAEAVKWFSLAAAQGDALAQCFLAEKYLSGEGVAKDEAEALRLYRAAAEQGNADGQYRVGDFYENGRAVPADPVEALKWHQLAAAQGHGSAQSRVYALTTPTSEKVAKSAWEIFKGVLAAVWGIFAFIRWMR